MSKLSNTNITWDGIGDVFENHGTSGTRSGAYIVGGGNGELQDRSPRSGGSAKSSVSANTFSADDFKGAFRVVPGHQTYQTGSSKGQVNNAIFGWGTAGGVQAATSGSVTTAQGTLFDGTDAYTTSAKPLSELGSQFNSNKWLSFIGYHAVGFTFTGIMVFEGAGAGTGDTDWTSITYAIDGTSGGADGGSVGTQLTRSGNFTMSSGYSRVICSSSALLG